MKHTSTLLALALILCLSFIPQPTKPPKDHAKFLGSWSGSETDQQQPGLTKHWVQTRFKDGTYILMFTAVRDCQVQHVVEKGKWSIKDGLFYELHEDGKTDVYTYQILDDQHIKFKTKSISIEYANAEHEFVDTKL